MVIKYKCYDKVDKKFRHADPDNMVSMRLAEGDDVIRIVADYRYRLILFTGLVDGNGKDIYPGDILDDERHVDWDILNGCWLFCSKDGTISETANKYQPEKHQITGSTFFDESWPQFEQRGNIK